MIPAVIFCDPSVGSLKLGTLSLLDRLVVTLHRGGCRPIKIVCLGSLPALKRARALGCEIEVTRANPVITERTLIAVCEVLVQTGDVKRLIATNGRLIDSRGELLPIGTVTLEQAARCSSAGEGTEEGRGGERCQTELLQAGCAPNREDGKPFLPLAKGEGRGEGESATVDSAFPLACNAARVGNILKREQGLRAVGIAERVIDFASARHAERMLWKSLTSDTDGFVDVHFNRPLGRWLSKGLIHTPVTPNQVTLASMGIGLAGACLFARGDHAFNIWGAILFQLSALVDCVDGDVARMVFKESPIGKWLDIGADQVVHVAVFGAIAYGASRGVFAPQTWILGGSAVLGVLLSFLVVLRGMLRSKDSPNPRLQKFLDKATTRDFSVLVLALACFDKLEWFLWLAAIGVHIFWVTALLIQSVGGEDDGSVERLP
ncbi:MAG: CDP-alcohol phosphatidyltransferase family protein [Verrucomicrobia bacterium]|nr:CDP-alcohol phosphatidyltransferase family protein [Verrucomicrobiota bacterium]